MMLLIAGRSHIESGLIGCFSSAKKALSASLNEFEAITDINIGSLDGATMIFTPLFQAYERLANVELKAANDRHLKRVRLDLNKWLLTPSGKEFVMMEAINIQSEHEKKISYVFRFYFCLIMIKLFNNNFS